MRDQLEGVAEGGGRPGGARVGLPVAGGHRVQGENNQHHILSLNAAGKVFNEL